MNENMTTCKVCGKEIAKSAKSCPECGARNQSPIFKKWWFWLIAVIILILVIPGRESTQESNNQTLSTNSTVHATQDNSEPATTAATVQTETEASTPTAKEAEAQNTPVTKEDNDTKPVLVDVYSDENCLIQFYSVEKTSNKHIAKFRVTNHTDRTLTFQTDCIAFNNESTNNVLMSDEVSPNSNGTINLTIRDLDTNYFDLSNLYSISGCFTIIDFNDDEFHDGRQSYRVKYTNVALPYGQQAAKSVDEGIKVYDDENVSVAFLGTSAEEEYTNVNFRITNKIDEVVTIQSSSIALNGESSSDVMGSEEIAPLSTGNISMRCTIDTTFVDLTEISNITGSLSVITFDNEELFDGHQSYELTFTHTN